MTRLLVTGGAGFIGSHVALALVERGDQVVVLDDLSQGHRAAVPAGARLIVADLADAGAVDAVLAEGRWDAVLHFAALSFVAESMREPYRYLIENVRNGVQLIEACVRHGIHSFVMPSTAALFGAPGTGMIDETTCIDPASPYGESKWMLERALLWAERIHGMRSACLRFFNAAGADGKGRLGEDHAPETHLIPLAIDAALGRRPPLEVYGDDYPTPDGTCIRDFVHVEDLADALLRVLDRITQGSVAYNLGNGRGHSVLEVIRAVEAVSGRRVPHRIMPRRPGDPATLVAATDRIRAETGWVPGHTDIHDIVASAYAWRAAHPNGYGDRNRERSGSGLGIAASSIRA